VKEQPSLASEFITLYPDVYFFKNTKDLFSQITRINTDKNKPSVQICEI